MENKVVVVIEDGVVITVKSTDPNTHVDVDCELREKVYEAVESDTGLHDCGYNTYCPCDDR